MKDIDQVPATKEERAHKQLLIAARAVLSSGTDFKSVLGIDVAYDDGNRAWVATVETDMDGNPISSSVAGPLTVQVEYETGFFCFREGPAIATALGDMDLNEKCLLVDGHGEWHPRRCGLATYTGVASNRPTIGCAKQPYRGYWPTPEDNKGAWVPVIASGQTVAAAVRTRSGVNPVWVSPGNLIDLEQSVTTVLRLSSFRIPEPLRLADQLARKSAAQQ